MQRQSETPRSGLLHELHDSCSFIPLRWSLERHCGTSMLPISTTSLQWLCLPVPLLLPAHHPSQSRSTHTHPFFIAYNIGEPISKCICLHWTFPGHMVDDAEHPILGSASQAPDVGFDTTELQKIADGWRLTGGWQHHEIALMSSWRKQLAFHNLQAFRPSDKCLGWASLLLPFRWCCWCCALRKSSDVFSVNFATWNVCEFLVNKIVLFICVVIQHVSEAQFEQCHARTPKWTNKPFAEDRAGWSCTVRGFLRDGRHPPEHPSKHLRPHWKHVSRTVGNPDSLESSQSKQGPICRTGLQFGKRQVYKSKRFKMWDSTQDTKAKSTRFFKAFSAGKKKAYCDFLQRPMYISQDTSWSALSESFFVSHCLKDARTAMKVVRNNGQTI